MGRKQAGEVAVLGLAPLGLGEFGTSFSRLPVLLSLPDSMVIVISSSLVLMLTTVGSGDSHLGMVIMESAGCGFTTATEVGSSFLEGGGGIIPWFVGGLGAMGRETTEESGVGAVRFLGRDGTGSGDLAAGAGAFSCSSTVAS